MSNALVAHAAITTAAPTISTAVSFLVEFRLDLVLFHNQGRFSDSESHLRASNQLYFW